MKKLKKSIRLDNVNYAIRGRIMDEVYKLEQDGINVLKLNIGNPATFNFSAPKKILKNMKKNIGNSQGYSDSKGLISARKSIVSYYKDKGVNNLSVDNVYIGNGVSELLLISMQALLNKNDEVLIPMPDYPLWSAAVNLNNGKAIHYKCLESNNWYPDIDDIQKKITKKTKGIVIINPNNPTGSLYPKEILEKIIMISKKNNLIIFSDEIYDRLIYDLKKHVSIASLDSDVPIITFSGLSKSHMLAGFRIGWMCITGNISKIEDYINGINLLLSMRLCSNVPGQNIITKALKDYKKTNALLSKGGRLYKQREYIYSRLNKIDGISVVKPEAAFYIFPKIDLTKFNIKNDKSFVLDFLKEKHILFVHGSGFNFDCKDHFRIVFLAKQKDLKYALDMLEEYLQSKRID